jgi:C1A family cysteine protease
MPIQLRPLRLLLPAALALAATHARAASQLPNEASAPPAVKEKLSQLRKQFADPKYKFKLGYTGVSQHPIEEITGLKLPPAEELKKNAEETNARAQKWLADEQKNLGAAGKAPAKADASCAKAAHYDLREKHVVGPVRNQGQCGSCWDFAAMAALETSWAMINGKLIHASEQQILSCAATGGSCNGGLFQWTFLYLMFHGVASEADLPYQAKATACDHKAPQPYSASIWAFVHPFGITPGVGELKEAICEHGAVAATVYVSDAFQQYTGGVFNEQNNGHWPNHAIALIGWDDKKNAWLLRNQWGTSWGEDAGDPASGGGYMWIEYGSNRVGLGAAWVKARRSCGEGKEYDAGLCYPNCKPGMHGVGPVCWGDCPDGYVDDGATCRVPISTITKKTHGRGVGHVLPCKPGLEKSGALCYPACPAGFHGVGPVCWEVCPAGYTDTGAFCSSGGKVISRTSEGRGVGKIP